MDELTFITYTKFAVIKTLKHIVKKHLYLRRLERKCTRFFSIHQKHCFRHLIKI